MLACRQKLYAVVCVGVDWKRAFVVHCRDWFSLINWLSDYASPTPFIEGIWKVGEEGNNNLSMCLSVLASICLFNNSRTSHGLHCIIGSFFLHTCTVNSCLNIWLYISSLSVNTVPLQIPPSGLTKSGPNSWYE